MKTIRTLGCLLALALVCACGSSGYYDSQGNYHADNETAQNVPAAPNNTTIIEHDRAPDRYATNYSQGQSMFTREGFYDRNGYFIAMENGPEVPPDRIPPRGMCRVWFSDRDGAHQPPVEGCGGIQSRLPTGAYVLYGG